MTDEGVAGGAGRSVFRPVTVRCGGPVVDRPDGRCPQRMSGDVDAAGGDDVLAAMVTGLGWVWTGDVHDREALVFCPLHALAGELDGATDLGVIRSFEVLAGVIAAADERTWRMAFSQVAAMVAARS